VRLLLLLGALLAAAPLKTADKVATTLPAPLVQKFRKIRALTADFREEKKMAILVAPLVRSGTLAYEAPDHLAQEVSKPTPSRLVLQGNRLTVGEGDGKTVTTIDIEKQPAVGLLVRLLLGVLSGDDSTLSRHTRIAFRGKDEAWSLDLDPVDPLLQKLIKSMHISGRGAIIDLLTVVDRSGDETVTRFSNVKLLPGFSPQERAARFGS
jgi:outer membrane lipoprotein-sorting protein